MVLGSMSGDEYAPGLVAAVTYCHFCNYCMLRYAFLCKTVDRAYSEKSKLCFSSN